MSSSNIIPRIIHQIWFDFEDTEDVSTNRLSNEHKSILEKNKLNFCEPNYTYKLWNLKDALDFVKVNYSVFYPFFKQRFAKRFNILKCDVFRYLLMYHFGGLYIDLDFYMIKHIDELFTFIDNINYAVILTEEWYKSGNLQNIYDDGSLHNGFLISRPKHLFWWEMLLRITMEYNNPKSIKTNEDVWRKTGTQMLRNKYVSWENDDVCVLPYYVLCPYKVVSNKHVNDVLYCDNEIVKPMSLNEYSWCHICFTEVDELINKGHFTKCFSICVSLKSGSLWLK